MNVIYTFISVLLNVRKSWLVIGVAMFLLYGCQSVVDKDDFDEEIAPYIPKMDAIKVVKHETNCSVKNGRIFGKEWENYRAVIKDEGYYGLHTVMINYYFSGRKFSNTHNSESSEAPPLPAKAI